MGRKRRNLNGRVHRHSVEIPYPVEIVKKLRDEAVKKGEDKIVLDGDVVNIRSLRLDTFFEKGFKCVNCGIEGTHFIKEKSTKAEPSYHINLYGTKDEKEVLMTKDHIYPKSLGGLDVIENMQPMCSPCNGRKGNTLPYGAEGVDPDFVAMEIYNNHKRNNKEHREEALI